MTVPLGRSTAANITPEMLGSPGGDSVNGRYASLKLEEDFVQLEACSSRSVTSDVPRCRG